MASRRCLSAWLWSALLLLVTGCMVPSSKYETAQSQNRVLSEQKQAQLAEIENLKTHVRHVEDQLASAEEKAAVLEEQLGLNRKQLTNYQHERDALHAQIQGIADDRLPATPDANRRLAALAQRCPSLRHDPQKGIARLDTDILFDTGRIDLKPGAAQALTELARALKSPEAGDLKVFVVGHTDDRPIAHKPARDLYAGNFDLSTARAQNVAEFLRKQGLEEARLGVAGFGAHEPVAPNVTAHDRQKNRRVEIFVMAPDVPVVGWTDSTPNLY